MPEGWLPRDMAAHACWYYYVTCENAIELIGDSIDNQVVLEGDPWRSLNFDAQRMSIAMIYGLDSPTEIDKYWSAVQMQARALGMPAPKERYMKSLKYSQ